MQLPSSAGLTNPYPMFKGCSIEELVMLAVMNFGVATVVHVVIGLVLIATTDIGFLYLRIGSIFMLILAFGIYWWGVIPWFARLKKGKPNNFWRLTLAHKFGTGGYKRHRGFWDIRRKFKA